jgi:hypothetical protein
MLRNACRYTLAYLGVFAASLGLAIGVYVIFATAGAPEDIAMLYLEPGFHADALLSKAGPLYSALLDGLDHLFSDATIFGLSLRHSTLWFPMALAFVVWACLFSGLVALTHWFFACRQANAV